MFATTPYRQRRLMDLLLFRKNLYEADTLHLGQTLIEQLDDLVGVSIATAFAHHARYQIIER